MTVEIGTCRRIVMGLDASPASEAALRWAIAYAGAVGAEVVAVHAFEAPVYFSHPYNETRPVVVDSLLRDGVRRRFEEDWCAPLAAAGVVYCSVMADGRAADVLLDVADRDAAERILTRRWGLNTLGAGAGQRQPPPGPRLEATRGPRAGRRTNGRVGSVIDLPSLAT